jgi:hypothetical protein
MRDHHVRDAGVRNDGPTIQDAYSATKSSSMSGKNELEK